MEYIGEVCCFLSRLAFRQTIKISTIIVSVMDVGQEIDDDRGEESPDQIYQTDSVDTVLFGHV